MNDMRKSNYYEWYEKIELLWMIWENRIIWMIWENRIIMNDMRKSNIMNDMRKSNTMNDMRKSNIMNDMRKSNIMNDMRKSNYEWYENIYYVWTMNICISSENHEQIKNQHKKRRYYCRRRPNK